MVNIDVEACQRAKELFLQETVKNLHGEKACNIIINESGSITERLFNIGKEKGYYSGDFSWEKIPERVGSCDKLISAYYNDAKSLDSKVDAHNLGSVHLSGNGLSFQGPFNYDLNRFDRPWLNRSWDVRIEDSRGCYISCNPTRVSRALLFLYRNVMTTDMLAHTFPEMENLWKGMSRKSDRFADIFDWGIKNAVFKGEVLSGDVESASNKTTNEYSATYKYPLVVEKSKFNDSESYVLRFKSNLTATCGCKDNQAGTKTKDEPKNVESLCKHLVALLIEAKYNITNSLTASFRPKTMRRTGGLSELVTFYTPLERAWLPGSNNEGDINNADNPIFKQINAHLLHEYYLSKYECKEAGKIKMKPKPMRLVDFEFFQQYGFELILDPFLHIQMINGLNTGKSRTAFLTGNAEKGWLGYDGKILRGDKSEGIQPVYDILPNPLTDRVDTPLPLAKIPIIRGQLSDTAELSISPFRNNYTVEFMDSEIDDLALKKDSPHFFNNKRGDWNINDSWYINTGNVKLKGKRTGKEYVDLLVKHVVREALINI